MTAARLILAFAAVAAAGALLFGLWHIVVGGAVNGNPGAAGFGLALAAFAGAVLVGLLAVLRRLDRPPVDEPG